MEGEYVYQTARYYKENMSTRLHGITFLKAVIFMVAIFRFALPVLNTRWQCAL
jgi:hypothetical protein